jgi:hypothetical protein
MSQRPSGNFGGGLVAPYRLKGVILIRRRMRRLAMAVLAGVLFGVVGTAVASANADTPDQLQVDTSQTLHTNFDWW